MSIGRPCLWAGVTLALALGAFRNGQGSPRVPGSETLVPDVTVTTSTPVDNASTTFTVTIRGLDPETKWRELRLSPISGRRFPGKSPPTAAVSVVDAKTPSSTQTWHFSRESGGGVLRLHSDAGSSPAPGFGNGTYTITVPWHDPIGAKRTAILWEALKAIDRSSVGSKDLIADSSGTPAPNVPQVRISANDEIELVAPIGATTPFTCTTASELSGRAYEIYASTRLVADYSDALGIGIDPTNDPLPPTWKTNIEASTGMIDAEGLVTPKPSILVPSDAALVKRVFYVVFAVKHDGSIAYSSSPLKVTIGPR